jgi:CheY-like chemotaxis protein
MVGQVTREKIKVMIVDDHLVVRRGLTHIIQTFKDMELVAEADSGEEALLWCRKYHPDVVLMDVKMEGLGGIAATEAIGKFYAGTSVIALSTFYDGELVEQMMAAGLADEVRRLVEAGYDWGLPAMSGLGYIQFRPYFAGEATLEDVVERIKLDTHAFIRRQYAWFRPKAQDIHWLDVEQGPGNAALPLAQNFLQTG